MADREGRAIDDDDAPKPLRLVSSREELAAENACQAAALLTLAGVLQRAEDAGDWKAVREVKHSLAAIAHGLDALGRGAGG